MQEKSQKKIKAPGVPAKLAGYVKMLEQGLDLAFEPVGVVDALDGGAVSIEQEEGRQVADIIQGSVTRVDGFGVAHTSPGEVGGDVLPEVDVVVERDLIDAEATAAVRASRQAGPASWVRAATHSQVVASTRKNCSWSL